MPLLAVRRNKVALVVAALLVAGCRTHPTGKVLKRGALECVRWERSNYPLSPWQWWVVKVDGKTLPDDNGRVERGSCKVSPNPAVEVLIVGASGHRGSAALQLRDGKPLLVDLHTPLHGDDAPPEIGLWGCNGRCMVYSNKYVMVETGEAHEFPELPVRPLTLSPDGRTAVVEGGNDLTTSWFCVLDLDTHTSRSWTVARSAFPWLSACNETDKAYDLDGSCRFSRGSYFRWKRGASGRDELAYPSESADARSEPGDWAACRAHAFVKVGW